MAYSFKGNLSFGFVYIPVTLHLAVRDSRFSFRLFDQKTKSRVQYKKTCADCRGREVKNEDILRGYEYEDGKYVMFTDEDLEKLKTKKDRTISIEQFVTLSEINPVYFEKTYYVVPTGAEKAYCLLMKAMEEEGKAGLGKTVLGTKESLVLIRANDGAITLTTLYFKEEIRKYPAEKETGSVTASELKLAKMLIKEMTMPFAPETYRDEYAARIKKAVETKIKGNRIVAPKERKEVQIPDLMDALKVSLGQYQHKKNSKNTVKKKKDNSLGLS